MVRTIFRGSVALYLIALSFLLAFGTACTANERAATVTPPSSPTAVYFVSESNAFLTQTSSAGNTLLVASSKEQLETMVAQYPGVSVLYFDMDTVQLVDDMWLRQAHAQGVVIVALHTPLSMVAEKLGIEPQVEDLPDSEAHDRIGSAIIRTHFEPDYRSHHQLTEYFPDFAAIVHTVNSTVLDQQ